MSDYFLLKDAVLQYVGDSVQGELHERLSSFLAEIDKAPLDGQLRSVFSDWLEENTDHTELCNLLREWEESEYLRQCRVLEDFSSLLERDLDEILAVMKNNYFHKPDDPRTYFNWASARIHLSTDTPDYDCEEVWTAYCYVHSLPLKDEIKDCYFVSCSC